MDPRYSRRLAALALLCACLLLTIWLESTFSFESFIASAGHTRSKRSTSSISHEDMRSLLKENKVRDDPQYEKLRLKLLKKQGVVLPPSPQGPATDATKKVGLHHKSSKTGVTLGLGDDQQGQPPKEYIEEYREEDYNDDLERVKQIRSKVFRCLPKFICEVHSQGPEEITTDFEREWLNMYSPSLLNDRVHDYQVAAHMGQLFRGYQPSPCTQLYTGCPITMGQLKKFLSALDIKKNRF